MIGIVTLTKTVTSKGFKGRTSLSYIVATNQEGWVLLQTKFPSLDGEPEQSAPSGSSETLCPWDTGPPYCSQMSGLNPQNIASPIVPLKEVGLGGGEVGWRGGAALPNPP